MKDEDREAAIELAAAMPGNTGVFFLRSEMCCPDGPAWGLRESMLAITSFRNRKDSGKSVDSR